MPMSTALSFRYIEFSGSTSSELWIKSISCPSNPCTLHHNPMVIDYENSNAYILLNYNSEGVFFAFDYTSGTNVGTRYVLSFAPDQHSELIIYNSKIIILASFSTKAYIATYDITANLFEHIFSFVNIYQTISSISLTNTGHLLFLGEYVNTSPPRPMLSKAYYNAVGALDKAGPEVDPFSVFISPNYLLSPTISPTSSTDQQI